MSWTAGKSSGMTGESPVSLMMRSKTDLSPGGGGSTLFGHTLGGGGCTVAVLA